MFITSLNPNLNTVNNFRDLMYVDLRITISLSLGREWHSSEGLLRMKRNIILTQVRVTCGDDVRQRECIAGQSRFLVQVPKRWLSPKPSPLRLIAHNIRSQTIKASASARILWLRFNISMHNKTKTFDFQSFRGLLLMLFLWSQCYWPLCYNVLFLSYIVWDASFF